MDLMIFSLLTFWALLLLISLLSFFFTLFFFFFRFLFYSFPAFFTLQTMEFYLWTLNWLKKKKKVIWRMCQPVSCKETMKNLSNHTEYSDKLKTNQMQWEWHILMLYINQIKHCLLHVLLKFLWVFR